MYIVGGLIGGFMCIFIPLVHLVTTWLLPIGGIFLGYKTMLKKVQLYTPSGPCPNCGHAMQLGGGSIDDRAWQVCPACKAPIVIIVAEENAQPADGSQTGRKLQESETESSEIKQ
ncbi:MAG TPA: hypothetical protein VG711_09470 [Phycisphaerales bacterium]|nr:hypothetical protein [Phycisphaerales bacterium]